MIQVSLSVADLGILKRGRGVRVIVNSYPDTPPPLSSILYSLLSDNVMLYKRHILIPVAKRLDENVYKIHTTLSSDYHLGV